MDIIKDITKELQESRDWSKVITGYDELISYSTSEIHLQYELWYLFRFTTDKELKDMYDNVTWHNGIKGGWCYDPEIVREYERRKRYK